MLHRITKIEPQKRRKSRFSVFVDDVYAFSLDADLLVSSGIAEGDEVDDARLAELRREGERRYALERAYRLLAARDRSEAEMRQRLQQIGFDEETVEHTLGVLRRQKYLDDRAFAERFARSQLAVRPVGRRELQRRLREKGIHEDLLAEVLSAVYPESEEEELARREAVRRLRRYRNETDRRRVRSRIASFLARRGFEWPVVQSVLDQWAELEQRAAETSEEDGQSGDDLE